MPREYALYFFAIRFLGVYLIISSFFHVPQIISARLVASQHQYIEETETGIDDNRQLYILNGMAKRSIYLSSAKESMLFFIKLFIGIILLWKTRINRLADRSNES